MKLLSNINKLNFYLIINLIMKLKTKKGGFIFKAKKTNICDNKSKKTVQVILLEPLSTYNFYGIVNNFENTIMDDLRNKKMEDFKNYKTLAKDLYKQNKIGLDELYNELYKYYITKTKSKISKSTFFSLMTKYFEIIILYTIAKSTKDLLFSFKSSGYNNVNRNRGKLLTQHNENLYGQLETDLNNKISAFLEFKSIDCNSYKIFNNIFTGHLDNLLGMYDRIEKLSKESSKKKRNSLRNSGYSTNSNKNSNSQSEYIYSTMDKGLLRETNA